MTLQTWLADELRTAGITVVEVVGWKTRETRPGFEPVGIVNHDTVTPPGLTRGQEQAILTAGRPDLAGPLAQAGLHRDGVVSVIAAGRANHNGYGVWGNDAFGLEVFCYGGMAGHLEPWNPVQVKVVAEFNAVVCHHFGWNETKVKGHKETDPARKIDPFGIVMQSIRADVHTLLFPPPPDPNPQPVPEDDMAASLHLFRASSVTWLCNYNTGKRNHLGPIELDYYIKVMGLGIEDVDQLVVDEFEEGEVNPIVFTYQSKNYLAWNGRWKQASTTDLFALAVIGLPPIPTYAVPGAAEWLALTHNLGTPGPL